MHQKKVRRKHSLCEQTGCYESRIGRGWGDGPWNGEPDRADFVAHGLDCFIHRNSAGAWCGYVGVTRKHPLFGKPLRRIESCFAIHGGVTYSAACNSHHLCHLGGKRWWVGFDCAHFMDITPGMEATIEAAYKEMGKVRPKRPAGLRMQYWTQQEVTAETKDLAAQVARFRGHHLPTLSADRSERRQQLRHFDLRDMRRAAQEIERARRLRELIEKGRVDADGSPERG